MAAVRGDAMKLVKWLGYVVLISLFLFFLRETVRVFTDEDLWFLHYLW
jgi:hypothetical protein